MAADQVSSIVTVVSQYLLENRRGSVSYLALEARVLPSALKMCRSSKRGPKLLRQVLLLPCQTPWGLPFPGLKALGRDQIPMTHCESFEVSYDTVLLLEFLLIQ